LTESRPKILIVDDERFYINVLVDLLKTDYCTAVAKNGRQALELAQIEPKPDLILLDILMPEMDGYTVCAELKKNIKTEDIPVIFLTVKSEIEDEIKGFELGAIDYITKPVSPPIVKARVKTHLALKQNAVFLRQQNALLEQRVQQRTEEICDTQDVAIYCLTSLAETRDNETGYHIRRTQNYVRALASQLKDHPQFKDELNDRYIALLYKSAPLHDIGKVGVPDSILQKPGALDAEEWTEMKKHSVYGKNAIERAETEFHHNSFLDVAKQIAYTHHEKWDGSGYPQGLQGDEIPIAGRLMAIADVYDALISKRVYKPAFSHQKAVEIITEGREVHFDPDVTDAFLVIKDEFEQIASRFKDVL